MFINPYLSFEGRCQEAIDFYGRALGAKVEMLMRFKEAPPEAQAQMAPGNGDKVMHASLKIGDTSVMLSDGYCTGKSVFQGISLSLTVKDEAEAKKHYDALAEGGQAIVPLHQSFFARSFGMVADRLGVQWMIIAPAQA